MLTSLTSFLNCPQSHQKNWATLEIIFVAKIFQKSPILCPPYIDYYYLKRRKYWNKMPSWKTRRYGETEMNEICCCCCCTFCHNLSISIINNIVNGINNGDVIFSSRRCHSKPTIWSLPDFTPPFSLSLSLSLSLSSTESHSSTHSLSR